MLAEFVATQCNQVLSQTLHHIDTFRRFCQLTFGERQHPLEPDNDQIPHDERAHFIRSATHEFLFELDDGVANAVFHVVPRPIMMKTVCPADLPRRGL